MSVKNLRPCFREPIPQIFDAQRYLDAAISAHLEGNYKIAETLIKLADISQIREWTESIWGKNSPLINYKEIPSAPKIIPKEKRIKARMPNSAEKQLLLERDGYHCKFCGIPLIRKEIRIKIQNTYPNVLKWGKRNNEQHAAFQAMWLQYDHFIPHSRGGGNSIENIVITCAPCNYGRMDYLIEEVGISDPRENSPMKSNWDGLERLVN